MNVKNLVKEGAVPVLAEGFHVEEIDPRLEKPVVAVADRLKIFGEGEIEVREVVTEENVALLIGLDLPNLHGTEEAVHEVGVILVIHGSGSIMGAVDYGLFPHGPRVRLCGSTAPDAREPVKKGLHALPDLLETQPICLNVHPVRIGDRAVTIAPRGEMTQEEDLGGGVRPVVQ